MINYNDFEKTEAVPDASSMIESFRAVGYSIESAVADIVDNSISAGAKNVWIDFDWKGSDTWLYVLDNGIGMNNEELIQAMRPGSRNPLSNRENNDLGRFGLGLKTASFSQCRKLTVISKKDKSDSVFWTWNLDFVNQTGKWELLKWLPDNKFKNEVEKLNSGTIVIWNDIDRLVKNFKSDDKNALDKFLIVMETIKKHLSMVFHNFITSGKIKIYFKNRLIDPWDPFLVNEMATQEFPDEPLLNGLIIVKGYVLPHKSKINEEILKYGEGPRGWNEQQGFYIYRNGRLLLSGDWLGLFRKEEHYKLARIKIDLPNSLDAEWQIDIKKSVARPPLILREQLKAYAGQVRKQALEVYRHRGKTVNQVPGQKFFPLWEDHRRGDKWYFRIKRDHPLIERIKKQAETEPKKAIEILLRFIEETIPTKSIYIREAEEPEAQGNPFEKIDQEPVRKLMEQMFDKLISEGKTAENAKAIILNIEPFNSFPHFIEILN